MKTFILMLILAGVLNAGNGECEGAKQYAEEMKFKTIVRSSNDSGFLYLSWDRSGNPDKRHISYKAIPQRYSKHNATNTKALAKLRLQRSELKNAMVVFSKVGIICNSTHVYYRHGTNYYRKKAIGVIDETITSIERKKETYEQRKAREKKEKSEGYEVFKKMIEKKMK